MRINFHFFNHKSKARSLEKKPKRNKTKENLRTTLMLTIVCILFLITEFPQSILLLLSILIDRKYYENVYMPLGDLIDILALINNSINFLLYCTMSRAFRSTFYKVMIDMLNMLCCSWLICKSLKRKFQQNSVESVKKRKNQNFVDSNNFSLFTGYSGFANNDKTNFRA